MNLPQPYGDRSDAQDGPFNTEFRVTTNKKGQDSGERVRERQDLAKHFTPVVMQPPLSPEKRIGGPIQHGPNPSTSQIAILLVEPWAETQPLSLPTYHL
jgi:hypothetical protein